MARGSDQDISQIKQRLALIESRLEQVFEKLDMAPRNAPSGGGWWGGSDDDGATELAAGAGLKESKDAVDRLGG